MARRASVFVLLVAASSSWRSASPRAVEPRATVHRVDEERRLARLHRGHARHRYSPLAQITAENFNDLEVAWRFKTDNLGSPPNTSSKARRWWCVGFSTTAGTRRSSSRSMPRPAK